MNGNLYLILVPMLSENHLLLQTTGKIKKKKAKGVKKEKGRRKVSAYLLYSKHMRPSVTKEHPGKHCSTANCCVSLDD